MIHALVVSLLLNAGHDRLPPLSDVKALLPDVQYVTDCQSFIDRHLKYLNTLPQSESVQRARRDADRRHHVYSLMNGAINPKHTDQVRRACLGDLRRLVGDEAYYARRWPVPAGFTAAK
jgi:hypothetical protein